MKTILVATDFSPAARNAASYAVQFAKAVKARVILFHAFRFIYTAADSTVVTSPSDMLGDYEEELRFEANELNADCDVTISVMVEDALDIPAAIIAKATEMEAAYICIGMKGQGKTFRKVFGSTAIALSHSCTIPLMIIPECAAYTDPRVIALGYDMENETDISILEPLKEFGDTFNSKLFMTRIFHNKKNRPVGRLLPTEMVHQSLSLETKYILISDDNVVHGINDCIEKINADILVMVPRRHSLIERIFEKSHTNSLLFTSKIPVLILREEAILKEVDEQDMPTRTFALE